MIDLDKHTEAATVSLTKAMEQSMAEGNDPGEIEMQCVMFVDTSGSMSRRFQGGGFLGRNHSEMDLTVARNLGLCLTGLDPDAEIPVHAFGLSLRNIGVATPGNFEKLLPDWLKHNSLEGHTYYMPFVDYIYAEAPDADGIPILAIVHTDGIAEDAERVIQTIAANSDKPVFWIFVGHGQSLQFLRKLDTMDGRVVDNVALIELQNAQDLSDEEYYNQFVNELITSWWPQVRKHGITHK